MNTVIHFHSKQSPRQTLVAVMSKADDIYRCEIPYVQGKEIRTVEYSITKDLMSSCIQQGQWIVEKINGIKLEDLELCSKLN